MPDKSLLHMLLAVFFFSLLDISVKLLPRIPTHEIVFFRALIAFVLCTVMIKRKGIPFFGKNQKVLILRGLFGTAALITYFYTIKNMPLATAVSIQKLNPLITVFFVGLLLGEKVLKLRWVFFFMAFAGVLIVKGYDPRVSLIHLLIGIFSAVCSGLAYTCIVKLKGTEDPLTVIMYFPMITIPLVAPYTVTHFVIPKPMEWFGLLCVGISVQVAQYYLTLALHGGEASKVSIVHYLGIVMGLFFGWLIFNESYNLISLAGIFLILLAVASNSFYGRKST